MTREELLLELKDIAQPAEPAWWLLGPAQLWLIVLALAALGLTWHWLQRRHCRRWLRLATAELDSIAAVFDESGDSRQLALQLSRWLKQVALLAYPHRQAMGLAGSDWLEFLDQALDGNRFSAGEGRVFGEAIYQQCVHVDANGLLDLCRTWLQAITPRLLQRG